MRILLIVTFLISGLQVNARKNIPGFYQDHFGSSLQLYKDSTFTYRYRFDLISSWNKGKWTVKNNTIYFQIVPVLDTVIFKDENNRIINQTVVQSVDENANLISAEEYIKTRSNTPEKYPREIPLKLLFRKNKLYNLNKDGKPIKKKYKGFGTRKKYGSWYVKKE